MAPSIGVVGCAMKHEVDFYSPRYGRAVVVLLSWGESSPLAASVRFDKPGLTRLDAFNQGALLMSLVDALATETQCFSGDWVLMSSFLDAVDEGCCDGVF